VPKELTHWWLAAQAQEQLPLDSPTRQLLTAEQPAYLSGAVLPDTLLHLVWGPWSKTALRLAREFHEPPGNSYAPLIQFIEQQGPENLAPALNACLLGVAAHIEADIAFHPIICSLSDNDIGLHYLNETRLDLWLLQKKRKPPVWRLKECLSDKVEDLLLTVAAGLFDPQKELPPAVFRQALQLHSGIQSMYGSPGWQLLAGFLALLPIPVLRSRHKLFYPFNWRQGGHHPWPEHWLNPATGEQLHETMETITEKAVERISKLLLRVDTAGLLNSFREQPGENLITGVSATLSDSKSNPPQSPFAKGEALKSPLLKGG